MQIGLIHNCLPHLPEQPEGGYNTLTLFTTVFAQSTTRTTLKVGVIQTHLIHNCPCPKHLPELPEGRHTDLPYSQLSFPLTKTTWRLVYIKVYYYASLLLLSIQIMIALRFCTRLQDFFFVFFFFVLNRAHVRLWRRICNLQTITELVLVPKWSAGPIWSKRGSCL